MADFTLVDPAKGWVYDLQSVYSSYMGYFQVYNIPWFERSWGHLFETFNDFLVFKWPVITVTDAFTGKPHIVTQQAAIAAFLKMIKTRFGESLPHAPNMIEVTPFETAQRQLRQVTDEYTYRKLYGTLPAIVLAAQKHKVRGGDPNSIREIWSKRDKTFLTIDFEWNEKNNQTVLEFGYAAVRCGHLDALNHWPPNPDSNYRKGHYVVADYADKVVNKYTPNHPWHYAFGDTQVVAKPKLPQIVQAVISSLTSPESENGANTLVLVAHGVSGHLTRLEEMKIKLPVNTLVIDLATYERSLFSVGMRGPMQDPKTGGSRVSGVTLSLEQLLSSLTWPLNAPNTPLGPDQLPQKQRPFVIPPYIPNNSGNDAFMTLFAFQKLMEPFDTAVPTIKPKKHKHGHGMGMGGMMGMGMVGPPSIGPMSPMPMMMNYGMPMAPPNPAFLSSGMPTMMRTSSAYDLSSEFGQMNMSRSSSAPNYLSMPISGKGNDKDRGTRRVNSQPGIADDAGR